MNFRLYKCVSVSMKYGFPLRKELIFSIAKKCPASSKRFFFQEVYCLYHNKIFTLSTRETDLKMLISKKEAKEFIRHLRMKFPNKIFYDLEQGPCDK